MNTENSYTAKENADGTFTIHRNGVALFCPKTCYPIPMQGRVSNQLEISVTKFNCATNCPFASIIETGGSTEEAKKTFEYHIKCESPVELVFKLDKLIESPKMSAIKN